MCDLLIFSSRSFPYESGHLLNYFEEMITFLFIANKTFSTF